MKHSVTIMWFRQDLRIKDNPALNHAIAQGTILPIYILDDENAGEWSMGAASRVWLHYALKSLDESLEGKLQLFKGDPLTILSELIQEYDVDQIVWNRCYEPWRMERDASIKKALQDQNIHVESFNGSLLWEPWTVCKEDGSPYKVFTPFYKRRCLTSPEPSLPDTQDKTTNFTTQMSKHAVSVEALGLRPKTLEWHHSIKKEWLMSEAGAHHALTRFLERGLYRYKQGRDEPALEAVSKLSPYLHFGHLSPNQVWYAARDYARDKDHIASNDIDHFCSELGWREFSYNLLYHFQDLPKEPLQPKFKSFPWNSNDKHLKAWQRGQTGYPIVDAGMRQLWQTGYMHNRVRMIVGSFLVKNLRLHWELGQKWFWDCLVDADLASNAASWQWIAGCGADAAPYFRVFNPVTQGKKFDTAGAYVREFVPELRKVPEKYIHNPWEAPSKELEYAGVTLGKDYPRPIVDLKQSREEALEAFASLKELEV